MIGLIVQYLGREYRIGRCDSSVSIIASLVLHRDEFVFEGGGSIQSFQKIRNGIEFEVKVSEFSDASELITKDNDFSEIDPEYTKIVEKRDAEWEWNRKLEQFHKIERILKEEGLI